MPVFIRWTLVAFSIAFLLVAAAMVVGAFLPANIDVTRTISINRPPPNVWWVLTDYNNLTLWHPQYRGVRLLSTLGDKPTRWSAIYTDGQSANVVVSEETYPVRYAEQISDRKLPFSGRWRLELEQRDLTTKVTAHSHVELHRPLDRLFVRLFVTPNEELDRILQSLKRRVESSTVKPTPATS